MYVSITWRRIKENPSVFSFLIGNQMIIIYRCFDFCFTDSSHSDNGEVERCGVTFPDVDLSEILVAIVS